MKIYLFIFIITLRTIQKETYVEKKDYLSENIEEVKLNLKYLLRVVSEKNDKGEIIQGEEVQELELEDLQLRCQELFNENEEIFFQKYSRLCFTYDQYSIYSLLRKTIEINDDLKIQFLINNNQINFFLAPGPSGAGFINYFCDKKNNDDEKNYLQINDLSDVIFIRARDGNDLEESKGDEILKIFIMYTVTRDEKYLKMLTEISLDVNGFIVKKGVDGVFEDKILNEEEIKQEFLNIIKNQKVTSKCSELYKDYFRNGYNFLNENIVQVNMLPNQKKFSITVYEEKDSKRNLYTIEYNEDKDGSDKKLLKSMKDKKRILVGEILNDVSDDLFRIFDKGEFDLQEDLNQKSVLTESQEKENLQILYKSIYEGLRYNEKAFFCRMRKRNVFTLPQKNGPPRNFYSGSWNLKKTSEACTDSDIISEFNEKRKKLSQEEKKYSDDLIENNYTEDRIYMPIDFEDKSINRFWHLLPNTHKANPKKEKEVFGRKYIDFYKGTDFKTDKGETEINQKELVQKHSILLFTRFLITNQEYVPDEFFDMDDFNIEKAFMIIKSNFRVSLFKEFENKDPEIEFEKVVPYLLANVFTNFGNRVNFEDKGDNGQFVLEDLLTKDVILI